MRSMLLVALVALSLSACSRNSAPDAPRAFCEAAYRYEKELERQASKGIEDIERQIRFVERLHETAPRAVRDEAAVFLDAMHRVRNDPSVVDDPKIEAAVQDVNRYAAQGCEVYKSNRTPGGV